MKKSCKSTGFTMLFLAMSWIGFLSSSLIASPFTIEELEQLGASTVQESLAIIQEQLNQSRILTSQNMNRHLQVNDFNFKDDRDRSFFEQLSLEDIDEIEVSEDGKHITFHVSKSVTKDGVTALFSFSLVEEVDSSLLFDPLVFTPSKSLSRASKVGAVTKVIRAEELSVLGVKTVSEALQTVGNLMVFNSSGVSTLFLRGFSSGNTKVLFNGIDLKDSIDIDGSPSFGFIPIDDVDRIEIVSGSNAILYGSGSVAGVINIISKKASGISFFKGQLAKDAYYSTVKLTKRFRNRKGHYLFDAYVSGSYNYDDSRSALSDTDETDLFSNQALTLGLDRHLEMSQLSALLTLTNGKQDIDENPYDFSSGSYIYIDDPNSSVDVSQVLSKLSYSKYITHRINSSFSLAFHENVRRNKNQADLINSLETDSKYTGTVWLFEQHNVVSITDQHDVSVGFDYRTEKGGSSGYFNGFSVDFSNKTQNSIGVFSLFNGVNTLFSYEIGGRYELYEQGNSQDSKSLYSLSLSRRIPIFDLRLQGRAKTGFKLPSIFQRYSSYGNASLEVEESFTQDISLSKTFDFVHIQGALFKTDLENQIVYDTPSQTYKNVGESEFSGYEISVQLKKLKLLTFLNLDYTGFDSDNVKIPDFKGTLSAGVQVNKWRYGLFVTHVGKLYDTISRRTLDAYSYADVSIHYELSDATVLYTKLYNLFDTSYETVSRYSEPGLTVHFGLTHDF